eukprot:9483607-Pyramimonas_sp.AAC.1
MPCAPRVPGAPGTLEAQACQVRHMLQPRQVRQLRRTSRDPRCGALPPRSSGSRIPLKRNAGHSVRRSVVPGSAKHQHRLTNYDMLRSSETDERSEKEGPAHAPGQNVHVYCFLKGMVGLCAADMLAPAPSMSKTYAKWSRGARACPRFWGT